MAHTHHLNLNIFIILQILSLHRTKRRYKTFLKITMALQDKHLFNKFRFFTYVDLHLVLETRQVRQSKLQQGQSSSCNRLSRKTGCSKTHLAIVKSVAGAWRFIHNNALKGQRLVKSRLNSSTSKFSFSCADS